VALLVCLLPVVLWRRDLRLRSRPVPTVGDDDADAPVPVAEVRSPDRAGDITMEIPRALLAAHLASRSVDGQPGEPVQEGDKGTP